MEYIFAIINKKIKKLGQRMTGIEISVYDIRNLRQCQDF